MTTYSCLGDPHTVRVPSGTKVFNVETGEPIRKVRRVQFVDSDGPSGKAIVSVVPMNADGSIKIDHENKCVWEESFIADVRIEFPQVHADCGKPIICQSL